jgi:hypothetical protein
MIQCRSWSTLFLASGAEKNGRDPFTRAAMLSIAPCHRWLSTEPGRPQGTQKGMRIAGFGRIPEKRESHLRSSKNILNQIILCSLGVDTTILRGKICELKKFARRSRFG